MAGRVLTDDPAEAVAGAHAVYTDVWVSMGDDEDTADGAPRARSRPTASTTRCSTAPRPARSRCTACPAHPGEEITEEVLYGDRQRIWDQAENRRHAQKALLELLVSPALSARVDSQPGTPTTKRTTSKAADELVAGDGARAGAAPDRPVDAVVLTRERLQEALDDAVDRGRMTRDDATQMLPTWSRAGAGRPTTCCASSRPGHGAAGRVLREVDRARA